MLIGVGGFLFALLIVSSDKNAGGFAAFIGFIALLFVLGGIGAKKKPEELACGTRKLGQTVDVRSLRKSVGSGVNEQGGPMENLTQAVMQLRKERERAQRELSRIDAALQALGNTSHSRGPRRTLSLAARRKIAAAQRKRWAKFKKAQKTS